MKRALIIAALLAAVSCGQSKRVEEASLAADSFFAAYCRGDWTAAAALCSEPLKGRIEAAPALTEGMDTAVASAVTAILTDIRWEKEYVEPEEDTEDVTFTYSAACRERTLSYRVTLARVDKNWTVTSIQ